MARVSHKKIKQLIAQKQSKITDRQFFTSRILAAHFADIAAVWLPAAGEAGHQVGAQVAEFGTHGQSLDPYQRR